MRRTSSGVVMTRSEDASRSTPAFVLTIRFRKKASSSRCVFSRASTIENRGSAPRNTAASPWPTCRSSNSVLPGTIRPSALATFTATVVVPTPPFAPTKANATPPVGATDRCAASRRDRGIDVIGHQRGRDDFGDACSHRLEQERGIQAVGDDQDACRRVVSFENGQRRRQLSLAAHVQHQTRPAVSHRLLRASSARRPPRARCACRTRGECLRADDRGNRREAIFTDTEYPLNERVE